jgi:outer membrane protein TolC
MFGIMQERGSGFTAAYTQNQHAYTSDYGTGVNPTRGNYLLGVGMNWNLMIIARNNAQVRNQKFITTAMQNDYDLANQQIKAQLALADDKIKNALANYMEAPVQVKAANDAYIQKAALYKNGLATIVDVTQTLYALNRAETDRDIAFANVWQALLLKAASAGDVILFTNEF